MKKSIFNLFLILTFSELYGQTQVHELTHYIFPKFLKGTVLMKNGVKSETLLNYNSLTEEMIFDSNGTKLAMTKLDQIDTVFIQNRKFFIFNGKFIELLYKSKLELYVEYHAKAIDSGKQVAYGGTSNLSSTTRYSSVSSGGQISDLKYQEAIKIKETLLYWLKKDGRSTTFNSLRQLMKLFSEKESNIRDFIREKDVEYEDQESIIALIKYLESII